MTYALDGLDRALLNALQRDFPLEPEPFAVLGKGLDIDGEAALRRTVALTAEGLIRHIGPLFDARKLGYQSTLAAMRVSEELLERAASTINAHPGVSHNYARNGAFNLWFTLSTPADTDLQTELVGLARRAGAEAVVDLPVSRVFKLRTFFDATGDGAEAIDGGQSSAPAQPVSLSDEERAVINEVQQALPLVARPFDGMASHTCISTARFLDTCKALRRREVMRRFAAAVAHRRVGYMANAMACWQAPQDRVVAAGESLASSPRVSHCYERRSSRLWPYNLFAMVHGKDEQSCRDVADRVSAEFGLDRREVLFSTREFKKVRVKYRV